MRSFAETLDLFNNNGCATCEHFEKDCTWSINENCLQCVSEDANIRYERIGLIDPCAYFYMYLYKGDIIKELDNED